MAGIPIFVFQLLSCLLRIPLDFYFFSPILLLSLTSLLLFIFLPTLTPPTSYILLTLSLLLFLLYPAAVLWARSLPTVPGPFQKLRVSAPNAFPTAPAQLARGELIARNTNWFLDAQGRCVLLRGVNLGGDCKLPATPNGSTFNRDSLINPGEVSFVGRPLGLDEADLHLARLRAWGLTFLRLLITWEAVEHRGPGDYDEAFLDYLINLINKCKSHGISVFIDIHQDAWSRFTGGSGAPAWTLEKVGFDLERLVESAAAFTHQALGEDLPRMAWNSNNARAAAGTMWTLLFAGDDFAPKTLIDGEPAQRFLRKCYANMLRHVASRVRDCGNVIGFDIINEPNCGFIDQHLTSIAENSFYLGHRVAPWDAVRLAAGFPQRVGFFSSFLTYAGKVTLNPSGVRAWRERCVWEENGLYEVVAGRAVLKVGVDYFRKVNGKRVDLLNDYALPFAKEMAAAVREEMPDAIIFVEPILNMEDVLPRDSPKIASDEVGFVWAKHWYEGLTLMTQCNKKYVALDPTNGGVSFNWKKFGKLYAKTLRTFREEAAEMNSPVLVGETGIPFNMHPSPFENNDFRQCDLAFNTTMSALEESLVSFTLWNYCASNSNAEGDGWNKEDLSIFSVDQIKDKDDLHAGGRCLGVVVRPYAMKTAGVPVEMRFDAYSAKKEFYFRFRRNEKCRTKESEVFVPSYQYPDMNIEVEVSDGEFQIDWDNQVLKYKFDDEKREEHWIKFRKGKKGRKPLEPIEVEMTDKKE